MSVKITATRLSKMLPIYDVTFHGNGKVLQVLLELLKIGRQWNTTAKQELDVENINEVVQQIVRDK